MKKLSSTTTSLPSAETLRQIADQYDTDENVNPYVEKAYAILKERAFAGYYSMHASSLNNNIFLLNDRMKNAVYQRLRNMGFVIKVFKGVLVISWEKTVK